MVYSSQGTGTVLLFVAVSSVASVIAFLIFRFQDCVPRYFSARDALELSKAVLAAELITCITLFSLNRLEGIPRSAIIIHGVLLAVGLTAYRVAARLFADDRNIGPNENAGFEHLIMIGSNQFSSLYIKLLKACDPFQRRVVGVLDTRPNMKGRALEGVRIVGAPEELEHLVEEYLVHGIRIDRVVVGGGHDYLTHEQLSQVRRICTHWTMRLDFVPQLVGLGEVVAKSQPFFNPTRNANHSESSGYLVPSGYFRYKPVIDFCAASILLTILLPLLLIVTAMVLLDVGSPVLFWQQRLGLGGRSFLLYKFRTLRPPFNDQGAEIPSDQRLSFVGRLLRDTGLDELPQLLNVLVGDMSLIGPRPLLPEDQPVNSSGRLSVRPGITGWAQVNGGKLLTAEEKVELDEWYVKNASLWVDINLVWRTFQFLRLGARRSDGAISDDKNPPLEHWQKKLARDRIGTPG